ncbi:MAG: hypothetical protein JO287_26165 [Pseudonocardiales bacterium]|nr:hypothetical protein [Pseudonocardiales bacterium]
MPGGRRARSEEFAIRVNAAAELVAAGASTAGAARELAVRCGLSERQARRYVDRAVASGPMPLPAPTTTFTVKLPVALVARVRAHATGSGHSISSVVTQALEEFLPRDRRGRPRR